MSAARDRRSPGPAQPAAAPSEASIELAALPPPSTPVALVPTGSPMHRVERPRFGAGPDAWEPEKGQQGVTWATPRHEEFDLTVTLAAAQALEDGVAVDDIQMLPAAGTLTGRPQDALGPALDRDHRISALQEEITQLRKHAEADRRNSEESTRKADRQRWRRRADDHQRKADQRSAELSRLHSRPVQELPLPSRASVKPVTLALAQVARPEPAQDLAETAAVHQLFRDPGATPDGLLIRGVVQMAVPTTDRLLLLGPIEFILPNRCMNGVALLLQHADLTRRTMAPQFRTRAERQRLVDRLQVAPAALPRRAAEAAAAAFFAAVPALLLGEPSGEPARAWNDPRLAAHLRRTYRSSDAGSRAASAPWLRINPARQALSYAVADAEHPLTPDEVAAVLHRYGVPNGASQRAHQFTADQRAADAQVSGSWGWPPAVLRLYRKGQRRWQAALRACPTCGGPAELVVRVPELPYACMCSCGGAPGLPPGLRMPHIYQLLAATREELNAYAAALTAPLVLQVDQLIRARRTN